MEKKIMSVVMSIVMLFGCFGITGCSFDSLRNRGYLPEYESGYYKYAVQTKRDGTQKAYLVGLTECGLEQTALVYPEEIDGIPVYGIGYDRSSLLGPEPVGSFGGRKLKKIFFPTLPEESTRGITYLSQTYVVYWGLERNTTGPIGTKGGIFGYNYYVSNLRNEGFLSNLSIKIIIANVSYLYNYNFAPNEGYYWVDSYDESVITFIPPEPEREGYTFGGWYKEVECINAWDFSTDITGKEIKDLDIKVYDAYEGIYLYAKWIKN